MADTTNSNNNNKSRTLDTATGIAVVKGGNVLGAGFLQSIQDAYTNVTQNSVLVIYGAIIIMATIAEFNGSTGPLELMKNALDDIIKNKKEHSLLLSIAVALSKLLGFLIVNKLRFIAVSWVWLPYVAKPSKKNMFASGFLTLFCFFSASLDLLEIILISQCFYLWATLRSPTHKMVFVILGIALFIHALELDFKTDIKNDPPIINPVSSSASASPPLTRPTRHINDFESKLIEDKINDLSKQVEENNAKFQKMVDLVFDLVSKNNNTDTKTHDSVSPQLPPNARSPRGNIVNN